MTRRVGCGVSEMTGTEGSIQWRVTVTNAVTVRPVARPEGITETMGWGTVVVLAEIVYAAACRTAWEGR